MTTPIELRRSTSGQHGFTLLEVLIAVSIFLIGIAGLMLLGTMSLARSNSQGNQATKTTEYAQDKMEAIMSLPYLSTPSPGGTIDNTTDLTQTPPVHSVGGCCGLTDNAAICDLTAQPSVTNVCYVDYVTSTGAWQSGQAGAQYIRRWRIQDDISSGNFKTITVQVQALSGADYNAGGAFMAPMSTLSTQMAKD